jgi:hypothetical protein
MAKKGGTPSDGTTNDGSIDADETGRGGVAQRIADALFDLVGKVPQSEEPAHSHPAKRARSIATITAAKAALSAGSLALPPGPWGWLTILPELRTVWMQQARMVADIAGAYGKGASLSRELMLYCLFRHLAPSAFRGVITQSGERIVIRRASPRALRAIVQKIGLRISLRVLGRGVSRWVPVVGALGVGAYAYYDTGQVAATAMEVFALEMEQAPI